MVSTVRGLGATTAVTTIGVPAPDPPSIVSREFKRDLNIYLGAVPGEGAKLLRAVIDANAANPVEGLEYQQGQLVEANAVDLADPATQTAYAADRTMGQDSNRALIDTILNTARPWTRPTTSTS